MVSLVHVLTSCPTEYYLSDLLVLHANLLLAASLAKEDYYGQFKATVYSNKTF